jgi:DNA-binding response OmpR family regulator
MRILIIEDHEDMAANIGDFLEARGHTSDFALDGLVGLHLAVTNEYDVIVLDLGLPGMDGLTVCRKLREEARRDTPVLMLTARDTLPEKLEGFESGADDYLVKPFALQELHARLRALTSRGRRSMPEVLRVADLELDSGTLVVRRAGRRLELNRTCIRILEILIAASPRVVRRATIEHEIWGDLPPDSDALRSHIYTLRRTIDRPFDRPLLHTVHGVGFRLAAEEDE